MASIAKENIITANFDSTKIQKYPAYKDSGAEWLGDIPVKWDSIKMKHLFQDVSIKKKGDAELLSVTQDQGVVPRTWVENRMVMPSGALESFKFINKGDFAISLRSFEGGLEYCHHDGIISPAYTVLKAKRNFESQFYKYLFKSFSFISELQTSVVGIRQGKNISFEELSYSYLPIPPLDEQTAIAAFLDHKTALIDQAIGIKQKQIELLKERRQILIHQAVTRGLNPNVKLKDSGVEWIGEIPEGWEVKKVKHFGMIRSGESVVNSLLNDSGQFEVYGGNGNMGFYNKFNVEGFNIIIGRVGAYCGNVRLINEKKWISDNALILTLNDVNIYSYISILLEVGNLNKLNSSNAQPLITGTKVLNFQLPIPSKIEQNQIQVFIDKTKTKIANAISLKEQEIEKLKEYKATLINSAVTGKIKVS
jgi:type I restriction enzyme S subunit